MSLAKWSSFQEGAKLKSNTNGEFPDMISIFTYDIIHVLQLGLSVMLQECLMGYLQFYISYSHADEAAILLKPARKMGKSFMPSCNYLLNAIQNDSVFLDFL